MTRRSCLLLPVLTLALFGQPTSSGLRIEPIDGSQAVWISPGDEIRLRVRVADGDSNPVADQSIVFVAPPDGPSGVFTDGDRETGVTRRVRTDASGTAEAVLRVNQAPGPFLVSAWLEGTEQAAHLAISSVTSAPGSSLEPAAWISALRLQLPVPETAHLYGPFLIDSGTMISTAGPPSARAPDLIPEHGSIFFWIDDDPLASYDHPVRFVLLDAQNDNPELTAEGVLFNREWWPVIARAPGEPAVSLVAPLVRIREVPTEADAPLALRDFRRAEPSDTCAVIIYGPDRAAFENSAADMRSIFKDTLQIPEGNIIEDTTSGLFGTSTQASTPTRIRDLLTNKLKEKNCKKLFFYYAGHGYPGGFCPANETDADKDTEMDFMPYTELAGLFEQTKIPEICLVIQGCHTGSAIPAMQNHGFNGVIATAAQNGKFAYSQYIPGFRESFWTGALTQTWRDLATIEGQDISLSTVAQAVGEGRDPNSYAMVGMPRVATIDALGGVATAPTVVIVNVEDPKENPKGLTVTAPEGLPEGDGTVEILIDDPSIANDKVNIETGSLDERNSRIFLRDGKREATFEVQGLRPGTTGYTLTFKDVDGKTYRGRGTIRVGAGYQLTPSRTALHSGRATSIAVTRGTELQAQTGTTRLTITPADAESAAVASPSASELVFPPGSAEQRFEIRALKPGSATFRISDGNTTQILSIDVVNLALVPNSVRLRVGQSVTVQLNREGPGFTSPAPPFITIAPPAGAVFATMTPTGFPFPGTQRTANLVVTGTAAGSGVFTVSSPLEGVTLTLPVIVEAAPAACVIPTRLNATFSVKSDPGNHGPVLRINNVLFILSISGTTVRLTPSGNSNLPAATGALTTNPCGFTASGRGTTAGFANILTEYSLRFDPTTNRWIGTVIVGKGGGLPGNVPIEYDIVATVP